jgi:hypothetical protein
MSRVLGALLSILTGYFASAQGLTPVNEYDLKARILLELLPYVQWPKVEAPADGPFVLVVLGKSPFGRSLEDGARTRTIQKRAIQVRYLTRLGEVKACDAIFLCRSEVVGLGKATAWARSAQVLTIADSLDFLDKGIMVNLLVEEDAQRKSYIKLAVNPDEARAGGLLLSSQLLGCAKLILRSPTGAGDPTHKKQP